MAQRAIWSILARAAPHAVFATKWSSATDEIHGVAYKTGPACASSSCLVAGRCHDRAVWPSIELADIDTRSMVVSYRCEAAGAAAARLG